VKGAVVGCGAIAEYHLRGWRRIPEVGIVALADVDRRRAELRRAEFAPAARVYEDLQSLLRSEPVDFVDIVTPPASHAACCRAAADAGVHIICQKPLALDLVEARTLVGELSSYPGLFAVHENHRWRPWFRDVVRRLHAGAFGTPRLLRLAQHDSREPPERFKSDRERALMLEYGTHLVDMMRALLGEPQRVYGRLGRVNPRVMGDSLALAMFEYEAATATIEISWKDGGPATGGFALQCDAGEALFEGRMTRGDAARFRIIERGETVVDEERRPTDDYAESFYTFERRFVDAILTGAPFEQTAAENLRTLECTFAVYESADERRVVEIR